jgi:hypothetical protein
MVVSVKEAVVPVEEIAVLVEEMEVTVVLAKEVVALVEEVVGEVAELQLQLYHLIHKKNNNEIFFHEIQNILLISDPN